MWLSHSLDQWVQKSRAAFRVYLPGTDAWIWPNNINPTAKVLGGAAFELDGRLDFIARQKFALTASGKYLDQHGAEVGIARRSAAAASGTIVATAPGGIAVDAGAQFVRSDGTVIVAASAAAGTGTLTVPAIAANAASAGNSDAGTPLTALSGLSGPGTTTAVFAVGDGGMTGGLDREQDGPFFSSDLSTYRGRILFRKRNPPQGGAPADYVQWASDVPGVTRVFVERLYFGPGSVRVFPLFDTLFSAIGGIPDAAHLALVEAAVAAQQPSSTMVTVAAADPVPVTVAVSGLEPNTTAVMNAIEAELLDTFQRLGQVAGEDPATAGQFAAMPFLAVPYSFAALWVDQAIANATGSKRAVVTAPTADIAIPRGSLPVLGNIVPL